MQEGELPAPTGLSLNKDDTIRETTTIAEIAQEHARWMLWRVLMGETLTEREIADDIDRVMIENGSNPDWPALGTIVASGANGAIPHGDPEHHGAGPKIVEPGDVVVVDLGARVDDWVSDVTRTYIIGGTTNATIIRAYMAVYDAQNLTFPLIESGTPAWTLDDVARTHIDEQGFGENFIHSLGHGFGVCVHEPPLLSSGYDEPLFGLNFNNEPLSLTDAITIEPGIYLDGWFGIRIEDDFLVDADGHEFLTSDLRRDLEYAMIMMEDYDPLPWHDPMAGDEESADRILPLPIGIIDVLMMAPWRRSLPVATRTFAHSRRERAPRAPLHRDDCLRLGDQHTLRGVARQSGVLGHLPRTASTRWSIRTDRDDDGPRLRDTDGAVLQ